MGIKLRQSGLTLTELAVVIAVMALLAGLALPAARMVMASFESGDGAKSMISAALASARGLAAKEGRYVGVRFQKAYNPDAPDPLNPLTAPQYMIFIEKDADPEPNGTGLANGFRAIEGCKPIKLPDSIGVMDLTLVNRRVSGTAILFADEPIDTDAEIDAPEELRDTTTFSVVFSPSGKLLIQEVRVRNRHGIPDTVARAGDISSDDVFNKKAQVDAGLAMFYQDDAAYLPMGLGPEYSRTKFVIYDREKFKRAFGAGGVASKAWSDYLAALTAETIYLNPYTGTIISKD
jgi:prepilin-type N-terminal cleavage/methylation domain-containing protein